MAGCYLHLSSFSRFAVPSSIVQITQDQNVTEGHNVTLMCNVSGIPIPMVSWMTPDSQHVSGYKLEVTNFHFSFTVPSSITQITQDQNVTEGDNLTLTCNASGMPQPNVSWIKPGGQRQYGHMLEFTNINRSQAGEYKCEASNECGNATETATIDVQCKYM